MEKPRDNKFTQGPLFCFDIFQILNPNMYLKIYQQQHKYFAIVRGGQDRCICKQVPDYPNDSQKAIDKIWIEEVLGTFGKVMGSSGATHNFSHIGPDVYCWVYGRNLWEKHVPTAITFKLIFRWIVPTAITLESCRCLWSLWEISIFMAVGKL